MLNGMTYNELARECHTNNSKWWHDLKTGERLDRNKGELVMLMVSEIAEAMEGERKDLKDDKLPHRKMAEVELVDAIIRIADFAGGFDIDLDEAAASFVDEPSAEDIAEFPTNRGEGLLYIVFVLVNAYQVAEGGFIGMDELDVAQQLVGALMAIKVYANMHGYDLDGAYTEKTAFNKVRPDHKAEARLAEGGKKF